jgi:TonB family protein
MNTDSGREFVPTIIDSRPLLGRLALELTALGQECELAWPNFKRHPISATSNAARATIRRVRRVLLAPNVLAALLTVAAVVLAVVFTERVLVKTVVATGPEEVSLHDVTVLELNKEIEKTNEKSIGRNSSGRVGFRHGRGEGSGEVKQASRGGGGGGGHEQRPPQTGKLPPPSNVLASIPKTPPTYPPALPVAGIDIDPALWKDMKAPVYGDPRSSSTAASKGPGEGEGIGTNRGLGIGEGDGPGVGPGSKGNMGGQEKDTGCCGDSGGNRNSVSSDERRIFRGAEVEQRARLILKPEPQYSEEARRNQITGTVMLRVVFSSSGQVEQIRAIQNLPFGLTERAIAAARMIKFVPAMKGGRPVSMYMQLEYNFNLY